MMQWIFGKRGGNSVRSAGAIACTEECAFRELSGQMFDLARSRMFDSQKDAGRVPVLWSGNGVYRSEYPIVPAVLPNIRFEDPAAASHDALDFAFLWGNNFSYRNAATLVDAMKRNAVLVVCEDGWLRSADTWANHAAPPRYRHGCSAVFDTVGCYCDATRESTVERMLNDPRLEVTAEERREARRLIDRIVAEKLTKYNHQPLDVPKIGRPGRRKVLVVDQSYGDFAVRNGWADDSTFERMLADAVRDNPDADVLVKTHPDTMTGRRKGYYDSLEERGNVFRATMPVNPYSLLELVDKVYVCSTQFGFEALMAGREVHVYGMPFYAGWGITCDRQKNPRRTKNRTLEEICHVFYVLYTRWYNPDTGLPCSLYGAMDWLLDVRAEYEAFRRRRA